MVTQYDKIAEDYAKSDQSIEKRFVYDPTFVEMLGDLSGKSVLDFACGSGHSTRLVKEKANATSVIGVDISKKQIELAKKFEQQNPLGIEYHVGDAARDDFSRPGSFDVVTAAFLLHYSATRQELLAMCQNIFNSLNEGGVYVGLQPNPDEPNFDNKKFDVLVEPFKGEPKDGEGRKVTYYQDGKPMFSFYSYHWSKKVLEEALYRAGFGEVVWYQPMVSAEGVAQFEPGYWDEYLERPPVIGLICSK